MNVNFRFQFLTKTIRLGVPIAVLTTPLKRTAPNLRVLC